MKRDPTIYARQFSGWVPARGKNAFVRKVVRAEEEKAVADYFLLVSGSARDIQKK